MKPREGEAEVITSRLRFGTAVALLALLSLLGHKPCTGGVKVVLGRHFALGTIVGSADGPSLHGPDVTAG